MDELPPIAMPGQDGDELLFVEFYKCPTDGRDHIKMRIPGDNTFLPDFIATEEYRRRFPRHWQAYLSEADQAAGQMRLEEAAWIDEATRNQLKALHVFTIDALAGVSDGNLANIGPGAGALRDRARTEAEIRRKADQYDGTAAEIAELKAALAAVKAQQHGTGERRTAGARK